MEILLETQRLVETYTQIDTNLTIAEQRWGITHVVSNLWGLCSITDAREYAGEALCQILIAKNSLLNQAGRIASSLPDLLLEFQDIHELTGWDNLTLQAKTEQFVHRQIRNLEHLKWSTSEQSRVLEELQLFRIRNNRF